MRSKLLFYLLLLVMVISASVNAYEITHYGYIDHEQGTWTANFSVANSVPTRTNANIAFGDLRLANSSGIYSTNGYIITEVILPLSVVAWGNVTYDGIVPENTTIIIKLVDTNNKLFMDQNLANNSVGFNASFVDVSQLHPQAVGNGSNSKSYRLKIIVNMTTNNTNSTPIIDNLTLKWIVKNGTFGASKFLNTSWPFNQRSDSHIDKYWNYTYYTPKWTVYIGNLTYLHNIYDNKLYTYNSQGYLYKLYNITNGEVTTDRSNVMPSIDWGGLSINDAGLSYGFGYDDVLFVQNMSDFSLKWTKQFNGGHQSGPIFGEDGTLYLTESYYANKNATFYALNPNGTEKWKITFSNFTGSYVDTYRPRLGTQDIIYMPVREYNYGFPFEDDIGTKIYGINITNQSIAWSYDIGGYGTYNYFLLTDSEGTLYTSSKVCANETLKNLFAIYPNGTLKWNRTLGVTRDYYYSGYLINNDVLFLRRAYLFYDLLGIVINTIDYYGEAINTTDGSLLWTSGSCLNGFSDASGNIYSRDTKSDVSDFISQNPGTYYGNTSSEHIDDCTDYISKDALVKYGPDRSMKWRYGYTDLESNNFFFQTDENGVIYTIMTYVDYNSYNIVSLGPWNLSANDSAIGVMNTGNTITFTAKTTMKNSDAVTGNANKIQAYIDNGDTVELTYIGNDSNDNTIWTGNYILPDNIAAFNHTYYIEASNALMETDIATHFSSPAFGTGNTGINVSGTFYVIYQEDHSCISDNECTGGHCVNDYCRNASVYCGDAFCDSGESCTEQNYCLADCGGCGGSSFSPSSNLQNDMNEKIVKIDEILANIDENIEINKDSIESVVIQTNSQYNNVQISVLSFTEKPSTVSQPSGRVYNYLDIKITIPSENIISAKAEFKVSKQWVIDNDVDENTITLNRYFDGKWVKLKTSLKNYDNEYFYFEAEMSGFSYFSITAKPKAIVNIFCGDDICNANETYENCNVDCNIPENIIISNYVTDVVQQNDYFAGIIIIVIFVAIYLFIQRHPKKKRNK